MRTLKKNDTCPTCSPDSKHAIWYAKRNDDAEPIWECACCFGTKPRRTCKRRNGMTNAQKRAVERIRRDHIRQAAGYGEDAEYKKFRVEDCGAFVSVVSEVGGKNDEGTLAACICRDHRHIFIGRHGALTLVNAKGGKKVKGDRVFWALTE